MEFEDAWAELKDTPKSIKPGYFSDEESASGEENKEKSSSGDENNEDPSDKTYKLRLDLNSGC